MARIGALKRKYWDKRSKIPVENQALKDSSVVAKAIPLWRNMKRSIFFLYRGFCESHKEDTYL